MRLIDADALERDGWRMSRTVQIDEKTMEAQTRKPTDFPAVEPQPEPCEDTISRQAAIDAINHICPVDTEYDCTLLDRVDVRRVLSDLPSAQPEIIRCHSCKHWTRTIGEMRGFGLGICDFHNAEYVTCNGFCHWAERREQDG